MKTLAAIALIGLVSASEDNEFFKFNNTKLHSGLRPQPHHENKAHNATVQPKPLRKVHPLLFNRTQNAHVAKPQNEKKPILKTFDDEELFLADNIPENQLNSKKGIGKFADRNKEWLAPVGHKVLDKLLSSFDDDELFGADLNDDELAGFFGKVGSFVAKNKNIITPVATKLMGKFDDEELYQNVYASTWNKLVGKLDSEDDELYQNVYSSTWNKLWGQLDDELHTVAASTSTKTPEKKNVLTSTLNKLLGNLDDEELHTLFIAAASQNKNVLSSTWNKLLGNLDAEFDDEELANFFGKVGSFVAKNKNVITPVATKLLGKFDSEDNFEFRTTTGQVASQQKNVLTSTFNKLLGKLDDEFSADELAFLASYNRILQKNGPIVAKVGMKALPIIAFEGFGEDELFNLDAFLNDAVKTYNDARVQPRNYGDLVNDGIQLVKDIKQKKHDDEELFNFNAFLNDAIKTYNDAKTQPRNYGDLVNDGIQLVKDIKQKKHDDEELYKNIVLSTGKKLFGIMGQDDDELFNLDAFLNDAVKTYNDARQNPRNYGNIVNDGIQLVKDIKQKNHDDEELFQLGNLINEAQSREEFVRDAIKTIEGAKHVNHSKKFLRH